MFTIPFLRLIILYPLPLKILFLFWKSFVVLFLIIPDNSHSFCCLLTWKFLFLFSFPTVIQVSPTPYVCFATGFHTFSGSFWNLALVQEEKTPTLSLSPIPALPVGTSLWHRSVLPARTAKTLATGYEPTVFIRNHLSGILSLMENTGRRRQVGGGSRLCFPSTLGIQTSAILTLTNDS